MRYDPGGYFKPHQNGSYTRPDGSESSRLTLMYLNDGGGGDFTGGETRFLLAGPRAANARPRRTAGQKGVSLDDEVTSLVPCCGDALVFSHELLHEGAVITAGRKYAVRTDVMYENVRRPLEARQEGLNQ